MKGQREEVTKQRGEGEEAKSKGEEGGGGGAGMRDARRGEEWGTWMEVECRNDGYGARAEGEEEGGRGGERGRRD